MSKNDQKCCSEWLDKGLCAILPLYDTDGANCTEILLEEGSRIKHKRKLKSVLIELAGLYQKDLSLLRKNAAKALGQKSMLPISISPGLTLVPFKIRKPVGKDDGAVGYVIESAVIGIDDTENDVILKLKGGFRVIVFEKFKTAQRHLEDAGRVRKNAMQYSLKHDQMSSALNELVDEYERPATRGDIALLSRRLLSLMEKLGV